MAKLFVILSPNVFYIFALSILFCLEMEMVAVKPSLITSIYCGGIRQAIGAFKIIFSFYKV